MIEEIEETELEDVNVEFFEFIQLKKNTTSIKLSEDTFDEKSIPSYSSLLAISNLYGYFVAGTSKGFIYASTNDLRKAFEVDSNKPFDQGIHIDILEGRVHFLRLTSDQLTIIAGIEGGQALCYDVSKISTKSSKIQPYQIMKFSDNIMDIRPNPGEKNNIVAFLLVSGVVYIKDLISNEEIGTIQSSKIGDQATAVCWSQKGKQLVCGNQSGKLVQFTPEGNEKAVHLAPTEIQKLSYCVKNILWLENTTFIVNYYPVVKDEDSEQVVYVVSRDNKSKTVYSKVLDTGFPFNQEMIPYMFTESIKEWGSDLKNLIICASTNSNDIIIIGRDESNEWASWNLSETARAILPSSDQGTLPVGMALDLSSTDIWFTKLTGDENSKMRPVPILLIYNNESDIVAYRCFQKNACSDGTSYPGMTDPIPIPITGPSVAIVTSPAAVITTSPTTVIATGPNMLGTITVGAQPTLTPITSVSNNVSAPVITSNIINMPENIPKNNFPPIGRPLNNNTISAVEPNSQNAPLKAKQASPTEPVTDRERSPHEIRGDATEKGVQEIQLLIDDIERNYLTKYNERTKTDSLENPNEWSIGDFPAIILETKRLEKEIKNIIGYLSILKQETTDLNLNFVKEDAMAKQEIGLLVSTQEVTPRRGTIQSRITEKYQKAFQNVKENAEALEKQLDMLYEQIKDHKANKFAGQPPLEYIDRSIQNISKGLYSNTSQIEQLNAQLDSITEQLSSINFNDRSDDFVSQQIEHETRKSTIPVKFSAEAEEKTNQIMKKEWKLFKILNINKSKRKVPYGTNLFSDIEPVQSHTSPKIISPRKKSPIKTRGSTQIGIEKLKDSIDRNKHGSPLRNSFSFDEESDYYNELDTPIKKNTYADFGLPISEDTNEFSQKYNQKISELREMRLRYFEKKRDDVDDINDDDSDYDNYDVNDNVYVDNNSTYERIPSRVRFQEPSDDDDDETTEEFAQKFEDIVDSDRFSRIHLTNNEDRIARLQIDPFENNFYEPSKFSDNNVSNSNISDYFVSSPESPKTEEGVSYSWSNERKDIITSEQSNITHDFSEDSLDAKYSKIVAADVSRISKVSEPQYDGEELRSDIIDFKPAERLAAEKKEEITEPVKEDKVKSTSEEIFQVAEPGEITIESEIGEVQPVTTREKVVTNESDEFATSLGATGLGSYGLREPSSFGETTSTPPSLEGSIPSAFSGNNTPTVPPAFAAPPQNVNAFNQTPSQPTFGQPSFGQSPQIPNAFVQPAFGQTGFGQAQATFGQVGLGQPMFGQTGLGQPIFGQTGMPAFGQTGFGPTPLSTTALKTPSGGGFARFASSGSGSGFGSSLITPTSANKPATSSDPTWSQFRK